MEIKNKNILITGSAKRIGREIALYLGKAGANIVVHYRTSQKEAQEVVDILKSYGVKSIALQADLEKTQDALKLAEEAIKHFGHIDVLINNASIYYPVELDKTTEEDLDRFYNVHVKSVFFLSRELGKIMHKRKEGRIINISDYSALRPYKDYTAYTISKGAMLTLTRAFAKELAPYVLVNAILPGPIVPAPEYEDMETPLKKTLLKKWAGEQEIAKAVEFLIKSDFVTGSFIPVEGGRLIC